MNKKILITIILISLYGIGIAQWQQLENYPENVGSRYIVFLNDTMVVSSLGLPFAIYSSSDFGASWSSNTNLGTAASPLIKHEGNLYAGTWGEGIFLSTDMGYSWTPRNNGLGSDLYFLELISHNNNLYACSDNIFYSEDGGASWENIGQPGTEQARCIVVAGNNLISSFLASTGWGVFKSTDNGENWTLIDPSTGIEDTWLETLSFFNNTIFASASMGTGSVYVSNDYGESWTAGTGLEDQGYNQIYDFVDHYGTIYAASMNGVYKSEDFGLSWFYFGCTNTLNLAIAGDTLYAGTGNMGIWKNTLPTGNDDCLPAGIEFSNQAQIDSFQINHPYCTEIAGNVSIYGNEISNLNGLNSLTSIGGSLHIGNTLINTDSITSLSGLENLSSIGGWLFIENMDGLVNLNGLEGLNSIGITLYLESNENLGSLSGLENLSHIGGELYIGNTGISNLTGLNNLNSIGYRFNIVNNNNLITLEGLNNLESIGEDMYIDANMSLTSLSGLDNLDASTIDNLHITFNESLSICQVPFICDYLNNPNGVIDIHDNANGCNNPPEIAIGCVISLPCLPYGNYYFFKQSDIDNFQTYYTNCNVLEGNVHIKGDDIINLQGLNNVTSFNGNLEISFNDLLSEFTGLENVSTIGGDLLIWQNPSLQNLDGFEGLNSIGERLWLTYNPNLNNVSALENLLSIGGNMELTNNNSLTNLYGLDNIEAESIADLVIKSNPMLSVCEAQSICDYLGNPFGDIIIEDNAEGCNSQLEVEEACDIIGLGEINANRGFSIYPNPAGKNITIECKNHLHLEKVVLYNQLGQIVLNLIKPDPTINISTLGHGLYIIEVFSTEAVFRKIFYKL